MFDRLRAVIGVISSGGRVPLVESVDCPYCGTENGSHVGYNIDHRPRLSARRQLLCRSCGRRLDHDVCDACGAPFDGGDAPDA